MKNEKSTVTIDTMIWLAIGIVGLFVLSIIITRQLSNSGTKASDFLSSAGDYDGDGIADFYDKCDCLSGDEKSEGCPINKVKTGQAAIEREEKCHNKIKTKA